MNILLFILCIILICYIVGCCNPIRAGRLVPSFFDINYTTISKGIAILMIMLCHCSNSWSHGRLLTPLGGIGVSIFLITSGYGLNESYKKYGLKDFWQKRLVRVYLPYFIVAVILGVFHHWDAKDWLLNLLVIKCIYWFISYIVGCYIVFWVCSKCFPKFRIAIISFLSTIMLLALPALQAEQSLGFITGILMSTYKERLMNFATSKKNIACIVALTLLIGLSFLAIKQLPVIRNEAGIIEMNVIQILIKWPMSIGILFGLMLFKPILQNPIVFLTGTISYELYIVHFPFYPFIGVNLWPALLLIVFSFITSYYFYLLNNTIYKKIIM